MTLTSSSCREKMPFVKSPLGKVQLQGLTEKLP
uniref:Uncharacterized protein n=1 Tax=Arundo donax TaxID=35708 RepID=A0A0A9EUU5_ARUDO